LGSRIGDEVEQSKGFIDGIGASSGKEEAPIRRIRLIDANEKRKKGACLSLRKRMLLFVSREEVSHDISFFVFSKGW
jgi:hypothetical protein